MKFLKRVAIFVVLLAIVYVSSVGIMKSNLHAANVTIYTAPSTLGKIAVGPRLADEIESSLLLDGIYTYQESDNVMHILCMVPYRFTNH